VTAVVGLTVIVKDMIVPGQPFTVGVTAIVAITGVVPVFVAVNEAIFPVPLAASPIEVALLVQLNTVPVTGPVKSITGMAA